MLKKLDKQRHRLLADVYVLGKRYISKQLQAIPSTLSTRRAAQR